ncbi:methyltransferase domain-containing protein [candidate division WWE3 bacterium]|nr:methyltransferase domain-containing protein [candidate division WWE3 bacterium]
MKIVIGNKLKELSKENFKELLAQEWEKIEVDLGTGNGRYVYKKALEKPNNLYIGIDPVEKQLRKYSRKAVRKNLENVLFVLASAEMLPEELENTADKLNVLLPWGSLLDHVANFNQEHMQNILAILKSGGDLRLVFGYTEEQEPTETERLNLENLNEAYIKEELIPRYENAGLTLKNFKEMTREDLQELETSWSKKLSFGKPRPMFLLEFKKK